MEKPPVAKDSVVDTLLRYAGVALIVYFVVQALTMNRCSKVAQLVGQAAPTIQATSLRGDSLVVGGARERPLVLDFWASWCGPCRASMPGVHAFAESYRGRVDVVTVNVESERAAAFVEAAAQSMRVTLPVVHDEGQRIASRYAVESLPTMVIIGRNGQVAWTHIGGFDSDAARTAIEAALR